MKNSINMDYSKMHDWEFYASDIITEYNQSIDEGLDISTYKDLFEAVDKLPKNEYKKRIADVLYDMLTNTPTIKNYAYSEPSDIVDIKTLRKQLYKCSNKINGEIKDKIKGAWYGRICGCMLGKTVEGIRTNELIPFLKETDNYPMHRYIYKSDIDDDIVNKYKFGFAGRPYADIIDGMPIDDDTNYTVLYQEIINKYGRDFTSDDIAVAWLDLQNKHAYCTAERVAYCNFIRGIMPPYSAKYQNPYREWIGAQIRADYFGYINPCDPETAADMAFRDASISHTKNGIYGEMFVAAMLAVAAETDNITNVILGGLSQIPHTSRLYCEVMKIIEMYNSGYSKEELIDEVYNKFNEHTGHGWCHTIPNAMIVVISLLCGNGDYGRSVCMAVEAGFDTDCNGATVGSILGMTFGFDAIPEYWTAPIKDTLHTSLFDIGTVKISDRIDLTLKHLVG